MNNRLALIASLGVLAVLKKSSSASIGNFKLSQGYYFENRIPFMVGLSNRERDEIPDGVYKEVKSIFELKFSEKFSIEKKDPLEYYLHKYGNMLYGEKTEDIDIYSIKYKDADKYKDAEILFFLFFNENTFIDGCFTVYLGNKKHIEMKNIILYESVFEEFVRICQSLNRGTESPLKGYINYVSFTRIADPDKVLPIHRGDPPTYTLQAFNEAIGNSRKNIKLLTQNWNDIIKYIEDDNLGDWGEIQLSELRHRGPAWGQPDLFPFTSDVTGEIVKDVYTTGDSPYKIFKAKKLGNSLLRIR